MFSLSKCKYQGGVFHKASLFTDIPGFKSVLPYLTTETFLPLVLSLVNKLFARHCFYLGKMCLHAPLHGWTWCMQRWCWFIESHAPLPCPIPLHAVLILIEFAFGLWRAFTLSSRYVLFLWLYLQACICLEKDSTAVSEVSCVHCHSHLWYCWVHNYHIVRKHMYVRTVWCFKHIHLVISLFWCIISYTFESPKHQVLLGQLR